MHPGVHHRGFLRVSQSQQHTNGARVCLRIALSLARLQYWILGLLFQISFFFLLLDTVPVQSFRHM